MRIFGQPLWKTVQPASPFDYTSRAADIHVSLPVPGQFNVSNALAAAAVGNCLEIPLSEIKTALGSFRPVKGRMNILRTVHGFHLIDDTYNANPVSVKAAIRTLTGLRRKQRGMAVLGGHARTGSGIQRPAHGHRQICGSIGSGQALS